MPRMQDLIDADDPSKQQQREGADLRVLALG